LKADPARRDPARRAANLPAQFSTTIRFRQHGVANQQADRWQGFNISGGMETADIGGSAGFTEDDEGQSDQCGCEPHHDVSHYEPVVDPHARDGPKSDESRNNRNANLTMVNLLALNINEQEISISNV
jgi:hypothetical protein